jgi:type IV pilus assembly protein PilV
MHAAFLAERRRSRGMTLVEVLIAIVIFAIGLLGIAALQVAGLRYTKGSQTRSFAATQAENMADRMRANPRGVAAGNYANPGAETADCNGGNCTASQLAAFDFTRWLGETRQALGVKRDDGVINDDSKVNATVCIDSTPEDGTSGSWACDASGDYFAIKIEWQERAVERGTFEDDYASGTGSADAGYVKNRFVMRFLP